MILKNYFLVMNIRNLLGHRYLYLWLAELWTLSIAFLCFALSHAVRFGENIFGYPVVENSILSIVLVLVRITGYALVVFGLAISFRR